MDPTLSALLPVGTLIVGIAGTLIVERLRDGRLERREAAARRLQREEALQARRDNFELENLTALMASTNDLLRASTRHHLLDRDAAKATGALYGAHRTDNIPGADEIGESFRAANVRMQTQLALLLDDALREDFSSAVDALNGVPLQQRPIAAADAAHNAATLAVHEAQMRVAHRIREIYLRSDTKAAASGG